MYKLDMGLSSKKIIEMQVQTVLLTFSLIQLIFAAAVQRDVKVAKT